MNSGPTAIQYIMADASAVQIGSACLADPQAPIRVLDEITQRLEETGTPGIQDIIGTALRPDENEEKK